MTMTNRMNMMMIIIVITTYYYYYDDEDDEGIHNCQLFRCMFIRVH